MEIPVKIRLLLLAAILAIPSTGRVFPPEGSQESWIPLFNGRDLSWWHFRDPEGLNGWKVEDGVYINTPPSTDLQTDQDYYDFQLHVEFNISPGGNSGVYMRDKYEIQILDSFGKPPAESGCGALYRRYAPATNASRRAGTWQTYDVTFIGRRLTVDHNGIRVLDNIHVGPKGTGAASDRPDGPGPLRLQGDHGKVFFRNVRIRPLSPEEAKKIQKQIESSLGWMGLLAQEPSLTAPFYADKQNLLRYLNRQGVSREVRTRSDWDVRRGHILENMQRVMGRLPSGRSAPIRNGRKYTKRQEGFGIFIGWVLNLFMSLSSQSDI